MYITEAMENQTRSISDCWLQVLGQAFIDRISRSGLIVLSPMIFMAVGALMAVLARSWENATAGVPKEANLFATCTPTARGDSLS